MGKGLLGSFATGVLQGVEKGLQRKAAKERQDKLDQRDEERHTLAMDEANRVKGDRAALADAVRPAQVVEGAADGGLQTGGYQVQGTTYTDRAGADAAVAKHNAPEAQAQRVSLALMERGRPVEALEFQGKAQDFTNKAQEFADKRWERSVRGAMPKGHSGLAELMTQSGGPFEGKQVQAVPSPDGKTVTYAEVTPEGLKPTPFTFTNDEEGVVRAGYALSRISPEARYKVMVDEDKREAAAKVKERELDLKERHLKDVQMPLAESRAALHQSQATAAEARATLAQAKAAAGGKGRGDDRVSKEERLRYTTLFTDAGRRMQDTQKALSTLQRDRSFMREASNPGTPQAEELAAAKANLKSLSEERQLYQGLLAGEAGGGEAGKKATDAAKTTTATTATAGKKLGSRASPHQPADKAAYEKIPKGDHYMHPTKGLQVKQ